MKREWLTTLLVAIGIGMQLAVAGCSSAAGWKVEFGVVPINAVQDSKQLTKGAK